jgi:hypothetical protein
MFLLSCNKILLSPGVLLCVTGKGASLISCANCRERARDRLREREREGDRERERRPRDRDHDRHGRQVTLTICSDTSAHMLSISLYPAQQVAGDGALVSPFLHLSQQLKCAWQERSPGTKRSRHDRSRSRERHAPVADRREERPPRRQRSVSRSPRAEQALLDAGAEEVCLAQPMTVAHMRACTGAFCARC